MQPSIGHGGSPTRRRAASSPRPKEPRVLAAKGTQHPNGSESDPGGCNPCAVPAKELLEDFYTACLARAIDDREIILQRQAKAYFHISGAGHEALCLGLSRSLRPAYDWFFPYYRDLALILALGVRPYEVLLQAVGSSEDPASGGRQMPSHWGYPSLHVVTQSSPTGSQCLPAVGCAEAGQYVWSRDGIPGCVAQGDEVTYVSLGEGATSEGEFWESLNTACRLKLPVLYVVADNGLAISVRREEQAPAPISELVRGFKELGVYQVDGSDYLECRRVGAEAVAAARRGEGPQLIHASVTRPYSHSSDDMQSRYRTRDELEDEAARDPLEAMARLLVEAGVASPEEVSSMRERARQEVAEAAAQALAAPRPEPSSVLEHVWNLEPVSFPVPSEPPLSSAEAVSMGTAINETLSALMSEDLRIRVFGEDVADAPEELLSVVEGKGGVFGLTAGLQRRFGSDRCYNTPLAEANIIGRAVGQALRGLRPAPEIQFVDYIWPAMQQLRSEAATIRWRSNGAFSCPMVIRVSVGGYVAGAAIWHSQCGEAFFTHIPGLLVAFPSNAADAAGLLRTAFRAEDPVLFLEHKHLLRQAHAKRPLPPEEYMVPFGKAAWVRRGRDLAIVTWGATVERSLRVAEALSAEGVQASVIDLRTLAPWDQEAVAQAAASTHRLLVVHEDTLTCGFGAEVAAWAAEHCFGDLDAPPRRVAGKDAHVGYEPNLVKGSLPQVEEILEVARELVRW